MKRRAFLGAVAGSAALGGCAGLPGSAGSTTDRTTTDDLVPSGDGDYEHDIRVANDRDREITLTIEVDRGGERLYRETHTVAAGSDVVVAGFTEESLPEGERSVTVTATSDDGETASVDVSITGCLGNVVFTYGEDGLEATYSIC